MLKIEHIGLAVKSLAASTPLFEKLLNTPCYKTEEVSSEQVNTAFFQKGETKIELLQGLTANSVITRYIEKKGEGIHHIGAITLLFEDFRVAMPARKRTTIARNTDDRKW